jgi:folate/biopterin transporter
MKFKPLLFFIITMNTCFAFVIPISQIPNKNTKYKLNSQNTKKYHHTPYMSLKPKQTLPISWSKEKGLTLFDIQTTQEIWAIILVYFVQGLLGISRLALTFYYKDTLHLGPAELSLISSFTVFPWIIKPLYGFISDTFPFFGYKRKSYLILSGLISSLSWVILAFISQNANYNIMYSTIFSILCVIMSSFGIAFSDVLVDAIVVNKSRDIDNEKAGALQSICWTSTSLGAIISGIFAGTLVQNYGSSFVFFITSIIPLMITAVSTFIEEDKIDLPYHKDLDTFQLLKVQLKNVWSALSEKSILYPLIFLILWQSTPSAGSALFYFEVNELGFQPEFLGRLGLVSSLSSLLGIMIYNQKLKSVPLRTIFKWTCITGTLLGMTPLILVKHMNRQFGLSDKWFAIGDDIILTVLGQIAFMPILVLAAKLCPSGIEAMLYATLMSVNNLSGIVAGLLGSMLTKFAGITEHNFENLPLLIIITNLTGLIPLAFLKLLPEDNKNNKNNQNHKEDNS